MMVGDSKGKRSEGTVHTDRIGKVFRVIITPEVSLRECLGCGELFSREASRQHAEVPCYPNMETYERGEIIEKTNTQSHRHWCGEYGHYYECTGDCMCICGLAMNGNDHSDCPVELRSCPEHKQSMSEEPLPEGVVEIMFPRDWQHAALPHCECGCSDIDFAKIVGWCFHCNHVYAEYSPALEDLHFSKNCPAAPAQVREAAVARLVKRRALRLKVTSARSERNWLS
jgi:hypothetical protein